MKALGAKILAVMSEVGKVGKDKTNSFHKYDYASDEAVVGEIRGALIKNRLVVIPDQFSCEVNGELTTLGVRYMLLDVDSGESHVSTAYGQGQDKGDKGVYKAATGAEKYFLLKTFLIATGDDAEKESPQRSIRPQSPVVGPSRGLPDPVADAHSTPKFGENLKTSLFEVSEPIASKNRAGKFYRKAIDSEGVGYYVHDDKVIADLSINAGKELTVIVEQSGKFLNIIGIVADTSKVPF